MLLLTWLSVLMLQASPLEAYRACVEVEDSLERLRCFDRAGEADLSAGATSSDKTGKEGLASRLAEAEREQAAAEARARAAERELAATKAAQQKAAGRSELPDEYEATIVSVRFTRHGNIVAQLSNGQIWEQLSSDSVKLPPQRVDRMQTATIKRGALGSRKMKLEPLGKTVRVRLRNES
ncbi:MAG: hypothetical protein V2I43_15000 [Parvularcula sp.]|jgi:hypothetical protein|nr:hypothetical protein [Parvularcula sp.]